MAQAFNLTAQLNLQGPSNIRQIVSDVKKQLGTISGDIKFKIDANSINNTSKLSQSLQELNKNLSNVAGNAQAASAAIKNFGQSISAISNTSGKLSANLSKAAKGSDTLGSSSSKAAKSVSVARTEMEEFGRQSALAVRRFAAFSAVTGVFFSLNRAINNGLKSFIDFDRELVRLQQVTGKNIEGLASLQGEITRLSIGLGVSSDSLIKVSSTLAQAGLSANDTRAALEALARSSLAPSFEDINQTVEGSIALMRQFGISAKDLEKALGSVNAVAAAFAVESSDIIAAIQRTGGVFANASKGVSEGTDALNEFIAVFTSVRATTRESAETIATGLRTIFTRIQRQGTIEALREYGVNLTDVEGKFVGAYKAVQLLSEGLNRIDPRDIQFSKIVEELGGFRQIGKVIPLIQQFATAQEALKVAQAGQGSLSADAIKAQLSLANQISKVREEFLALIRSLGQSDTFQTLARGALGFASGLIKITSALKGVLPALAILGAGASLRGITQFAGGFIGGLKKVPKDQEGGENPSIARSIGSNLGSSLVGAKTEQTSRELDKNNTALDNVSTKLDSLTNSISELIKSKLEKQDILDPTIITNLTSSIVALNTAIDNQKIGTSPQDSSTRRMQAQEIRNIRNDRTLNNTEKKLRIQQIRNESSRSSSVDPVDVKKLSSSIDILNTSISNTYEILASYKSLLQDNSNRLSDNTSGLNNLYASIINLDNTIKNTNFGGGGGPATVRDGGRILGFAKGGTVPGSGKGDKVPALLEPGEVVMSNRAVSRYGRGNLVKMNKYASGGAADLVNATINNRSDQSIGLQKDKYTYQPNTKNIVLSNVDRYEGTVIANGTPVKFSETKQPKGAKGIGYKQFEEIIEKLGYKRKNQEKKNYPIDFIKGNEIFDAKNAMIEADKQSMAKKSMLYVLDQSGIGFNYNAPKGPYKTTGEDLTLKGGSGSKLSTSVDQINLPTVTQLLVKYKINGSESDKQKIQEQMQRIPSDSRRYEALQTDLAGLASGEVGSAGAMAILPSQQRLAERNYDYRRRSIGGKIQAFQAGGVTKRNVGYIDYDVIANPANEAVVTKGMESSGVKGPRLYADYLTDLAVKARKDSSLQKLRAVYGVAGSGKTTLARGQGTDKGKLRETTRFPILTPEDIQKANEVLILSSTVSKDKLDSFFGEVDRAYTLSSTTAAEKERIKAQRTSRDITGVGLEGRTPGGTMGVGKDTAIGEALLQDRLGSRSVVLGRSDSGKLRRKKGDELVQIIKKKIGFTWGGFAPMTVGHESILDAAAAQGISPQDFIFLVGANEGINDADASSYRTAIFDQDARVLLAKAGAGAKGATVLPKARDFETPLGFDVSGESGRRKVVLPSKGSKVFVGEEKGANLTAKYKEAGYDVASMARTEGISATKVRELIEKGDLGGLQSLLSPGVYDLISNNIGRIQNRAKVLPDIIGQVKQSQAIKMGDIEKSIQALGISRIDKKKLVDPEYAAKVQILEELRSQRDKVKSAAALEPYKLLDELARSEPDKYGLDFSTRPTPIAKPVRTVGATQRASIGGLIQRFMAGGEAEETAPWGDTATVPEILRLLTFGGAAKIGRVENPRELLKKKKPTEDEKAKIKAIRDEATKKYNRRIGAAKGVQTRLAGQGLKFAAVGMFGDTFPDETYDAQGTKGIRKVLITAAIMDKALAEQLDADFGGGIESIAQQAAEKTMVGNITKGVLGGKQLELDFDRTLAVGADDIASLTDFRDPTIVQEKLKGATLTRLGRSLVDLVKAHPELTSNMRVVTARSQSTVPLIQQWLADKGLALSDSQFVGVGGDAQIVSESDIPALKAAQLRTGSLFVDDSAANISAAEASGKNIETYQYGAQSTIPNPVLEAGVKGVFFEKMIQNLGGPGRVSGLGFDYPKGLGPAAKYFNIDPDIPTDAKRTIVGAGTIKDNVRTYLKAMGYKAGGKVSFGTGFPFPRRISNKYFKDMEKMLDTIKLEKAWEAYPKDERIVVDDERVKASSEEPFNLELFKKSFGDKISRDGLFQKMGQFARYIGLPSSDLISFLPSQIDFVKPDGGYSLASFSKDPSAYGGRGLEGVDLSEFGFSEADKQDAYGYSKLIEEKKKEVEKVLKTPVQTFDDGSFRYDETKARALWDEINDLKQRYSEKLKLNSEAIAKAKESRKASAEASGRGSINMFQDIFDRNRRRSYATLYHEMVHQLFNTLRARQADTFTQYKDRVDSLFAGDNDDLADAFDLLDSGYKSADVVYGRSYKLSGLQSALRNAYKQKSDNAIDPTKKQITDLQNLDELRDITGKADAYTKARDFRPINPGVNKLLLGGGYDQNVIDKMEDNGKEEFLTTLVQNLPKLDSNLQGVLDSTLNDLLTSGGISRRSFAQGGLADATSEMASLMGGLYGNRASGESATAKKQKAFGRIGLSEDGDMITASYYKNNQRSGYVYAYKTKDNLYHVGLSKATSGYGPRLYDVIMEAVSEKGAMLTSDRSMVSAEAQRVWQYYFKNRGDVKKTPLEPEDWTKNQSLIDPKLYGRRETWPPATDPAWVLQSGYSKSPSLINDPSSVVRSKKKPTKSSGQMALEYFGRANGGRLGFADGGSVPALVSNGEAYVPPKLAKKIGYGTLGKINQADKNGMGRFSKGGISVFKGPGSGTSDSIPTSLPVGSFIIREKATKALGLNRGGVVQKFADGGGPKGGNIDLFPGLDKPFGLLEKTILEMRNSFKTDSQVISDTMKVFDSVPPGWEKLLTALDEYGSALDTISLVTYDQQNLMIRAYAKAIENLRATGNAKKMIDAENNMIKALNEAKARILAGTPSTSPTPASTPSSPSGTTPNLYPGLDTKPFTFLEEMTIKAGNAFKSSSSIVSNTGNIFSSLDVSFPALARALDQYSSILINTGQTTVDQENLMYRAYEKAAKAVSSSGDVKAMIDAEKQWVAALNNASNSLRASGGAPIPTAVPSGGGGVPGGPRTPPPVPKSAEQQLAAVQISALEQKSTAKENVKSEYDLAYQNAASQDSKKFIQDEARAKYEAAKATIESSKASQEQAILQDLLAQKAKENSLSVKDYISSLQDEITTRTLATIEKDGGTDPTEARKQAITETISSQGLQAFNVPELSSGNDLTSTMSKLSDKTTGENNALLEADKAKAAAAARAADSLTLMSLKAEQNGQTLSKYQQTLKQNLVNLAKDIQKATPGKISQFNQTAITSRTALKSGDSDAIEKAKQDLAAQLSNIVGEEQASKLNGALDSIVEKLQTTDESYSEIINSSTELQEAFRNAATDTGALNQAIEQHSANTGISSESLKELADASDVAASNLVDKNAASAAKLSGTLAKVGLGIGGFGSAISSALNAIGGTENRDFAVVGAGLGSAASTASTLVTGASQAEGAIDAASSIASKMGGPIGNIAGKVLPMVKNLILGPFGAIAGGAVALAAGFKDAWNAAREFDLNYTQKRVDESLSRTADLFDQFSKDTSNVGFLDKIDKELSYGSQQLMKNLQTDLQVPKAFWINLLDVGKVASFGGVDSAAAGRSMIAEKEGSLSYLRASFDSNYQQRAIARLAPEKAVETAQKVQPQGQNILRQFENRLRSGANMDDLLADLKVAGNESANVLARMNPKINEQIMLIENDTSLSAKQQKTQVQQIVAMEANRVAMLSMKNNMKQIEFEKLGRQTNNFAASLERMFNGMEQAINKTDFELNKLSRSAELSAASLSGNAKAGEVMLDSVNVLQNPRAYSGDQQNAAYDQAAGMFGSQAGLVRPLLGLGDKLESTVMSTINRSVEANPTGTTEGIASNIRSALDKQLKDLGLPKNIADKLAGQTKLAFEKIRSERGGEDTQLSFDQVTEEVPAFAKAISSAQRAQELAVKAMEFYQKNLNEYAQAMNQMVDYQIEANSRMRRASEIQTQGGIELSRALGKTISLTESTSAAKAPIKTMTGGLTDAGDIGRNVQRLEGIRQTQQASADTAAQKGPAGKDEFMLMQNRLRGTNTALRENIDALKQMADSTDMAQAALSKIQEVQQRRQAGANLIEKMVTSSPEELARLNASIGRLNNNMRGGLNVGSTSEQRGETLQTFNMIAPLLGDGQQQNELRANVLESMLKESGLGIDSTLQGVIDSLRDPEGDPQMAEAISVYRESLARQSEANTVLAELQSLMSANTAEIAAQKIATSISGVTLTFDQQIMDDMRNKIQVLIDVVKGRAADGKDPIPAAGKNRGGIIYASMGQAIDFAPKGTDTVPAMLTPGEFVVNRAATQANLPLLQSINNGYSNGGKVRYYNDGGYVLSGGRSAAASGESTEVEKTKDKTKQITKNIKSVNIPVMKSNAISSLEPLSTIANSIPIASTDTGTDSGTALGNTYKKIIADTRAGEFSSSKGNIPEGPLVINGKPMIEKDIFFGVKNINDLYDIQNVPLDQTTRIGNDLGTLFAALKKGPKQDRSWDPEVFASRYDLFTELPKFNKNYIYSPIGDNPDRFPELNNIVGKKPLPYWGLFDKSTPVSVSSPGGAGFDTDNMAYLWFLGYVARSKDGPVRYNRFSEGLEKTSSVKIRGSETNLVPESEDEKQYFANTLAAIQTIRPALKAINAYGKSYQEQDESLKKVKINIGTNDKPVEIQQDSEQNIKVKETMAKLDALYKGSIFSASIDDTDYVEEPITLYNLNVDEWNEIFKDKEDLYKQLVSKADAPLELKQWTRLQPVPVGQEYKDFPWIADSADIDKSIFSQKEAAFARSDAVQGRVQIQETPIGSEGGKYFIPAKTITAPFFNTTARNWASEELNKYLYIPAKAGTPETNPLYDSQNDKPFIFNKSIDEFETELSRILPNWDPESKKETYPGAAGWPDKVTVPFGRIDPEKIKSLNASILQSLGDKVSYLIPSDPGGRGIQEINSVIDATAFAKAREQRIKDAELGINKKEAATAAGNRFKKLSTAEKAFTTDTRVKLAKEIQALASTELSKYGIGIPSISKIEDVGGVAGYLNNYLTQPSVDNKSVQWAEINAWRAFFSELYQPGGIGKGASTDATVAYLKTFGVDVENGTVDKTGVKNIIAREKAITLRKNNNVSGEIPQDDLKNLDLESTKNKLYTVDSTGKKTPISPENIQNPKTIQDVEKIGLTPENIFESVEKRQSYLDTIANYFSKYPNIYDNNFTGAISGLKTWYKAQDSLLNMGLDKAGLEASLNALKDPDKAADQYAEHIGIIKEKPTYDPYNQLLTGEKYGALPDLERMKTLVSVRQSEAEEEQKKGTPEKQQAQGLATGGLVYASNGTLVNFQPRGTDTVPAMLTPGEFVINRDSTQKYRPVLEAINNGNYSRGGIVNYLKNGGYIIPKYYETAGDVTSGNKSGSFDFTKYMSGLTNSLISSITTAVDKALSNIKQPNNPTNGVSNNNADLASIDNFVNRLNNIANILSNIYIPPQITITGKHDVVVTINGDTVLNQLRPDLAGIVVSAIRGAFADLKAKNPENNTINFDIDIDPNKFAGNA